MLFYFFKKVPNNFFHKKRKERKIPLLLYATAKTGEMALAYLKSFVWKKKEHAQGVIVTVQNTFMYIPLTKQPCASIP